VFVKPYAVVLLPWIGFHSGAAAAVACMCVISGTPSADGRVRMNGNMTCSWPGSTP
jgi:hypothetical protein